MERLHIKIKDLRPRRPACRQAGISLGLEKSKIKTDEGQSLIEIMIGVAVSVILITSAATLISVTLKSSTQNKFIQAASFLSQDLVDKVTIFAESKWYCNSTPPNCGIYNLNKTPPNNNYYLDTSTPQFTWVQGEESSPNLNLDNVQYTRYFYVENVIRALCGVADICTGGSCSVSSCLFGPGNAGSAYDPSTQKLTVVTSWTYGGTTSDIRIVKYVTRSRNQVFLQTDWSGGPTIALPTPDPVATSPGNKFYTSTNINSAIPGSIKLQ